MRVVSSGMTNQEAVFCMCGANMYHSMTKLEMVASRGGGGGGASKLAPDRETGSRIRIAPKKKHCETTTIKQTTECTEDP